MDQYTTTGANSTITGVVMWNGLPIIDDDGDGTAGVREPLRPRPVLPTMAAEMPVPVPA
jgi:hypothetical protein